MRWSWRALMPFLDEPRRKVAIHHFVSGIFERSNTVPTATVNWPLQLLQYKMGNGQLAAGRHRSSGSGVGRLSWAANRRRGVPVGLRRLRPTGGDELAGLAARQRILQCCDAPRQRLLFLGVEPRLEHAFGAG